MRSEQVADISRRNAQATRTTHGLRTAEMALLRKLMQDLREEQRRVMELVKLHIEDIPTLAAGGLNDWRCRMLIGNSRDAISVDLPVTRRRAVGRQKLRLRLRSIVPIDDVVLGVADRRSEYVQSCCGDR